MSFTRRQVLAGLAGLGVAGLGAGGWGLWQVKQLQAVDHARSAQLDEARGQARGRQDLARGGGGDDLFLCSDGGRHVLIS